MLSNEARRGRPANSGNSWVTIGGVADQREKVRDQRGVHAKLFAHRFGIANLLCFAIHLHDAIGANALSKIFVRRPDADLSHA
jgi:hypothetical protein